MNRTFHTEFDSQTYRLFLSVFVGRGKRNDEVEICGKPLYTNREEFDAYYADYKATNLASYQKNYPDDESITAHIEFHIADTGFIKAIIDEALNNQEVRQFMANRLIVNKSDWLLRTAQQFGIDRPPHIEAAILSLTPLES